MLGREEAKKAIQQAVECHSKGEYEKAFTLMEQALEAGFIPAYTLIGDCYWKGQGVKADTKKAIQYYLSGAELGDKIALIRMGDIYLRCDETQKALDSYTKAAEKGVTDALFNLGNIYYSGIGGFKRDYSRAAEYFEKYIDLVPDDKEAVHLLGRCYVFMEEHDLLKAEELFAKAASLGNELAVKDLNALQLGGQIIGY